MTTKWVTVVTTKNDTTIFVGADVGFLGGGTPIMYITKINLKTLLKKKSEKTSEKRLWKGKVLGAYQMA